MALATSESFAISQPSGGRFNIIWPIVVSVLVAMLLSAGIIWVVCFRRRRGCFQRWGKQRRPLSLTSNFESKVSPSISPDLCTSTNATTFARDNKSDVEHRAAISPLGQRDATSAPDDGEAMRDLPPLPRPPIASPMPSFQNRAELPLSITPRSSRQFLGSMRRTKAPPDLDRSSKSYRPKSAAEAGLERDGPRSLTPDADQPRRLTLHRLSHLRKAPELDGSPVSPTSSGDAYGSSLDEESRHPSRKKSHRLSFHRLMQSRKPLEVEGGVDMLPEYSPVDQVGTGGVTTSSSPPPPPPPKDIGLKTSPTMRWSTTRSMAPVELEAPMQPPTTGSPPTLQTCHLTESTSRSFAGPTEALSPLSASSTNHESSLEKASQASKGNDADVPLTHLDSQGTKPDAGPSDSTPPQAVDFLNLDSSDSEAEADGEAETTFENARSSPSKFFTPLSSPIPEQGRRRDQILAAADAVSGSSGFSARSPITQPRHTETVELQTPPIHEMDAAEIKPRTRSRRRSAQPVIASRAEPQQRPQQPSQQRRRPDFVQFKKQMSDAEKRAKSIGKVAKRKHTRRFTLKNF
jgi:hypothetical protein